MKSESVEPFFAGVTACMVAWIAIIMLVDPKGTHDKEAVAKGHAHYNAITGEFEWNKPCGPQPPAVPDPEK